MLTKNVIIICVVINLILLSFKKKTFTCPALEIYTNNEYSKY